MYDAIDDPYTYKNSTVLVNRLDLRTQTELDAFEAEISTARAEEPLPKERWTSHIIRQFTIICFRTSMIELARCVRSESQKAAIPFAFPKTLKIKPNRYSMIFMRPAFYGISIRRPFP